MRDFGKRVFRALGLELKRCARVPLFGTTVHYLHIGKTAGTQIGHVISQVNRAQTEITMVKNGHGTPLRSLPASDQYFFSIRDPISRFRSGFYSRKRCGRPRLDNQWSPSEALIFAEFEHANDLAEALFRPDALGRKALSAMLTIGHIGNGHVDWFKKAGDIFSIRPPVWIVRQEHLEADVATLLRRLDLDLKVTFTADPVRAHVNDYSGVPELSEMAIANLTRWHSADLQFYTHCEAWMTENRID
jgi:hypothetical protein